MQRSVKRCGFLRVRYKTYSTFFLFNISFIINLGQRILFLAFKDNDGNNNGFPRSFRSGSKAIYIYTYGC